MKIIETHEIGKGFDEYNGKGTLEIQVQDDSGRILDSVEIMAGEPEDAIFYRDLSDAYNIVRLLRLAYQAGKNGEEFNYEFVDNSEEEDE